MEDLLKAKDEELTLLKKVKNALREQVIKLKDNNKKLKEKLKEIEQKEPPYPDLSKDLEDAKSKIKETKEYLLRKQKDLEKLREKFNNIDNEKAELEAELEELKKEPLSPEKLMEQLKTGMFKLGKQNFSIETKIDSILEKFENTGKSSLQKGISKKYTSPGLSQSNVSKSSPLVKEKPFKARKPSDILKSAPEKVEKKVEKKKQDLKSKHTPIPNDGIITIIYPEDGAIKCPNCGEQHFQEIDNKKKIIAYAPIKKYAKKYYCKACRSEWDYKY